MATHSSTLAWKIPWTEEPGGLQSMGLQVVGHDWATSHILSQSDFLRLSTYLDLHDPQLVFSKYALAWPCAVIFLVAQLCPTLCDPMDCSLPGFSVHGIFQARILKWVAISFSRGSSRPRGQLVSSAWQADSLPLNH